MIAATPLGLAWPEFVVLVIVGFPFAGLILLIAASLIHEGWDWLQTRAEVRDHQRRWNRFQKDLAQLENQWDPGRSLPPNVDPLVQSQLLDDRKRPEVLVWKVGVGYLALLALGGLFLFAADYLSR